MLVINHGFPVWERKEGSENQKSEAEVKGQRERRRKLERTGYRGFEIPDVVLLFGTTRTRMAAEGGK